VEKPLKECSPPKEVARSPPEDAALRMQCGLGVLGRPALRPQGHLKQDIAAHVEEELGAGAKTVKERREATKSGSLVQARKAAACWHG
jgi:hypothetical protein